MDFHFFPRKADLYNDAPAGLTVSKQAVLPEGDFRITEYCWGSLSLWFIDADEFTADEREAAYQGALVAIAGGQT